METIKSHELEISYKRGYYPLARLGHVTKPKQYQNTTKLDSRHRTTMTEHTIELNYISSAIKAEQQDDLSVVANKSHKLEISCERGYYPLVRLGHVTITRSQ